MMSFEPTTVNTSVSLPNTDKGLMMIKGTFLRSKIGRRIFSLFICCSMIPVAVLSILSFTQVTRSLEDQVHRRLHQSTKALGLAMFERLLLLDNELRRIGFEAAQGSQVTIAPDESYSTSVFAKRFRAIFITRDEKDPFPLYGKVSALPAISREELEELKTGNTGVFVNGASLHEPRVYMVRLLDPGSPKSLMLMGEVETSYLWSVGPDNTLPPMTDLCVLDQWDKPIVSSIPDSAGLLTGLAAAKQKYGSRQFYWEEDGTEYMACYWTLFLRSSFVAPNWTVVLSESKAEVFAPLNEFKRIFPCVILLSLLVVAFLSMYYLRQTLVPLEAIKEGIQHISRRDFGTRITVTSGDEFEEVAATFNEMSAQLGRQFRALSTKSEIDRAVLSSLDTERIISTVLTGIQGFLSCHRISINLLDAHQPRMAVSYSSGSGAILTEGSRIVTFTAEDRRQCLEHREFMVFRAGDPLPGYITAIRESGVRCFLVLPVFVKDRLAVTINMGYGHVDEPPEEDLLHARQLADQMAVALSNSSLMEELDQLNWGTLKALARTVDAKSTWTAGHSERVLEMSMRIAGSLGLPHHEQEILHRAALLHDIGKVGIPNRIIDKPGRLTSEEYELIKKHSFIGARILEPVAAYKEAIPIVLQHHERYDGKGYPNGLRGESIHLGARIIAIADVFDAMLSNRPYRAGLGLDMVVNTIRQGAGSQFDPQLVETFLDVVSTQEGVLDSWNLPPARKEDILESVA